MNPKNPCTQIREELPARVYGELAPDVARAVDRHLAGCEPCSQALEALRETRALLSAWEAPHAREDPRKLAARTREQARRTARLRTVARVAAAAAGVLFVLLTVLGSELRVADGELIVSLRLAGLDPGTAEAPSSPELESVVRRIAAEEVQDWTRLQQAERARLVAAFDRLRAADQRVLAGLLDTFQTQTARENDLTRKALVDLASFVARPQ